MAKLKDVLEGKGGGEYFTPEDVEGKECIIVEDIDLENEIREHKTGKKYEDKKSGKEREQMYYCISVNDGKETKDLHLTWVGLKNYFAPVMPKTGTWKGQKFVITAVKTKGKLDIENRGKTEVTEQMQLQQAPERPAMADYMIKIIDKLTFASKIYPDGIPANIFTEAVEAELRAARITENGAFNRVVEALKAEGKIFESRIGFYKVVV